MLLVIKKVYFSLWSKSETFIDIWISLIHCHRKTIERFCLFFFISPPTLPESLFKWSLLDQSLIINIIFLRNLRLDNCLFRFNLFFLAPSVGKPLADHKTNNTVRRDPLGARKQRRNGIGGMLSSAWNIGSCNPGSWPVRYTC